MGQLQQLWNLLQPLVNTVGVILGLIGIIGTVSSFMRQYSPVLRRRRRLFLISLAIAAIVGVVFAAGLILPKPPPPSPFPREANTQTLTVDLATGTQDLASYDPADAVDTSSYAVDSLIYPSLVTLNDHLQVIPWAAQSFSVSPDGKIYIFHIRSGLKWSDGSPIDAYSFAIALNRTLSPCTQSQLAHYLFGLRDAIAFNSQTCSNGIIVGVPGQPLISSLLNDPMGDSIVVSDNLTLELNLSQAVPYFLDALTYPCAFAVPDTAIAPGWSSNLTARGSFGGNLFLLVQHGNGTVTLERNPSFWGTRPQLSTIIFDVAGTGQVQGKVDNIGQCASESGAGCISVSLLAITYIGLNWSAPPLNDVRMRQALALAIDKTQLFSSPYGTATNHIVPDGMPFYSNPSLTGPLNTTSVTGDIARAQQLASQYAAAACGGSMANCAPITLAFSSGWSALAKYVQYMWTSTLPGLQVRLAQTSSEAFLQHSVQAWVAGWDADYPDPQDFLSLPFLPEDYNLNDVPRNTVASLYSLLRQADVEPDVAIRSYYYEQAEQKLVDLVAWIPLYQQKNLYTTSGNVANYRYTELGQVSLDTWQSVYILRH